MNIEAKKLWERIAKKREELGIADFAVCQAEVARGQVRQDLGMAIVRFNEVLQELANQQGIDLKTASFNLDLFEFDVPASETDITS